METRIDFRKLVLLFKSGRQGDCSPYPLPPWGSACELP
jgi:hypothetical protein